MPYKVGDFDNSITKRRLEALVTLTSRIYSINLVRAEGKQGATTYRNLLKKDFRSLMLV